MPETIYTSTFTYYNSPTSTFVVIPVAAGTDADWVATKAAEFWSRHEHLLRVRAPVYLSPNSDEARPEDGVYDYNWLVGLCEKYNDQDSPDVAIEIVSTANFGFNGGFLNSYAGDTEKMLIRWGFDTGDFMSVLYGYRESYENKNEY